MLSTKLPGNNPVLPFLCSVPLNQPSSLFLWTNTMSPSLSSSSASLWGGYDTTTLYLGREARGAVSDWYTLQQWQRINHDTDTLLHFLWMGQTCRTIITVWNRRFTSVYLSHMMGLASWCWDTREEHGCRGGGAIGAHPSRGLHFRWEFSGMEEDKEADETAAASGSRQLTEAEEGEVSWPTAPCSTSPAAACSASRVGEEGGEGRDFFLLEDSSFRRLFFSLCSIKTASFFHVRQLQQLPGQWHKQFSQTTHKYILMTAAVLLQLTQQQRSSCFLLRQVKSAVCDKICNKIWP